MSFQNTDAIGLYILKQITKHCSNDTFWLSKRSVVASFLTQLGVEKYCLDDLILERENNGESWSVLCIFPAVGCRFVRYFDADISAKASPLETKSGPYFRYGRSSPRQIFLRI